LMILRDRRLAIEEWQDSLITWANLVERDARVPQSMQAH
jgi:hypothetical protein